MTLAVTWLLVFVAAYFVVDRMFPETVDRFEQNFISGLLAAMVLISFLPVVARYGFHTGWGGAFEFTGILFAWLIMFGMGYAIKINTHLGVDAFIQLFPERAMRGFAVFGAVACMLYAVILLYSNWLQVFGVDSRGGALDYWAKMYKVGIGLDDLTYPAWMQETFGLQDRVQRWLAYLALPAGLGLFAMRCAQALVAILTGHRHTMIAAHEAEDLVAENRDVLKD